MFWGKPFSWHGAASGFSPLEGLSFEVYVQVSGVEKRLPSPAKSEPTSNSVFEKKGRICQISSKVVLHRRQCQWKNAPIECFEQPSYIITTNAATELLPIRIIIQNGGLISPNICFVCNFGFLFSSSRYVQMISDEIYRTYRHELWQKAHAFLNKRILF